MTSVNNIYDMAGNVYEWTVETYLTNYKVVRGEVSYTGANVWYTGHRGIINPILLNGDFSSRLSLYIPVSNNQIKLGEIVTESAQKYTNNRTATIPIDFAVVSGCDDVSQGLVISDDPNDTKIDKNNVVQ